MGLGFTKEADRPTAPIAICHSDNVIDLQTTLDAKQLSITHRIQGTDYTGDEVLTIDWGGSAIIATGTTLTFLTSVSLMDEGGTNESQINSPLHVVNCSQAWNATDVPWQITPNLDSKVSNQYEAVVKATDYFSKTGTWSEDASSATWSHELHIATTGYVLNDTSGHTTVANETVKYAFSHWI